MNTSAQSVGKRRSSGDMKLIYDKDLFEAYVPNEKNTLQLFITNRCNLRCRGCFYAHGLGTEDMSFDDYVLNVNKYVGGVDKVTLLGGEPTLHPDLGKILDYNRANNLDTTIYSNGVRLERLENFDLSGVDVRVGVYDLFNGEKPLARVRRVGFEVTIVYMLKRDNVNSLLATAWYAQNCFYAKDFMISSIRDMAATGNYWKDTDETLSGTEYAKVVNVFLRDYAEHLHRNQSEGMNLHIAKRGVLETNPDTDSDCCRFGNIFPDGSKVQCPFDIALLKKCEELSFGVKRCQFASKCILRKVILKSKNQGGCAWGA